MAHRASTLPVIETIVVSCQEKRIRSRLCADHCAHSVLKIAFSRSSCSDRKDHRMVDAGSAKACDKFAAVLCGAERPDPPHIGIAQRLVSFAAFTLAPESAHFGKLVAEPIACEHLRRISLRPPHHDRC